MADERPNWELILHRIEDIKETQSELNRKVDKISKILSTVDTLSTTVHDIKEWKDKFQEEVSVVELKEMKAWKAKIDELMSPKQLEVVLSDHEGLKKFKIQAMMIWVVIQSLMTLAIFWDKIF
jgi:SMC interacting uncharacterized protein involved in chromosome segregation